MKHNNVHSALDGAMKEEAPSHIHPSAPTKGRGEREMFTRGKKRR